MNKGRSLVKGEEAGIDQALTCDVVDFAGKIELDGRAMMRARVTFVPAAKVKTWPSWKRAVLSNRQQMKKQLVIQHAHDHQISGLSLHDLLMGELLLWLQWTIR